MAGLSGTSRSRAQPDLAKALEAATARIAAAAKGDLTTRTPDIVSARIPNLAAALDTLFANVSAKIDTVSTLAMFDPVTSLPNRTHFRHEAERLLNTLPDQAEAALLFVDLDNFKGVNDTYGHAQGDQLLALVASRLRMAADSGKGSAGTPLVGRLAGDEFTILIPNVEGFAGAARLGEALLVAMTAPFDVAGHSVDVGASVGIAMRSEAGHSLTELMRAADIAMYQAKTSGRRQFQFYTEALAEQLATRTQLDIDLRAGIARGELTLMVQPQISLIDGAVVAGEALLRWNHPTRGLLMPHKFLAAAEESGLIFDISDWSLVEATRIAAAWRRQKLYGRLAVNLGARQMNHADFFPRFHNLVAEMKVPVSAFEVEITEDNMMQCGDAVIRELATLRAAGTRITIDTAGIGMSSLAQLRLLPVDRIKIHRSLIAEIADQKAARAIVQAMIGLGHGLGCEVIAAGVETSEQIDILRVMGCDAVQGYAIAPPMSLDDFSGWRSGPKKRAKTTA